jgi:hypothetical protein
VITCVLVRLGRCNRAASNIQDSHTHIPGMKTRGQMQPLGDGEGDGLGDATGVK